MSAALEFEAWRATLREYCGHFDVSPGTDLPDRHGAFGKHVVGGMEMSHIATNYDAIRRDAACIARDDVDFLYLVRQISGTSRLRHGDKVHDIMPGDIALFDSRRSLAAYYGNAGVEFTTLHVPRADFFAGEAEDEAVEFGVARHPDDPRTKALQAALDFAARDDLDEAGARGFFIDLARLVFRRDPRVHSLHRFSHEKDRVTALLAAIDRNAEVPEFSLSALARISGMSERQVQRDLQSRNTNFSHELRLRRMRRVRDRLITAVSRGEKLRVAQIAYASGFSDLSNFNRAFRAMHGCNPLEYAAGHGQLPDES